MSESLAPYIKKLVKDPTSLSDDDVDKAMTLILHSKEVPDVQVAGFLVGARVSGRDHSADFIAATVSNLAREAKKIDVKSSEKFVDIVGTGGDGQNTFNVSTTSAIVAAGTGLLKVAKHGGPASTSTSGASDLLSNLGIDLSKVDPVTVPDLLTKNDFVFMSGPVFHPILARVKPIRKSLGVPTIFNLVGPLLNPAPIGSRVLGVYTPSLGKTYAESAAQLFPGTRALVVCGAEGLDEISPAGLTHTWLLSEDGNIEETDITPADFGLSTHPLSSVASGTPAENAHVVHELVNNKLADGNAIKDYVLMNTSGLLVAAGVAENYKHGVELARKSIKSGGAKRALEKFVSSTSQLSHLS